MAIERKLTAIPLVFVAILTLGLSVQFYATWIQSKQSTIHYTALKKPQSALMYRLASLDSSLLAGHLLTLKLQLHDNQRGRHINYQNMSFPMLSQWLMRLQDINPSSEYSALLAARVFSHTKDKRQLRLMLETVIKLFKVNPEKNWRWMAEGAVTAKYYLKDLTLALMMAKNISSQPKHVHIPTWARDLEFIILEELNMIDAAMYVVEKSLQDTVGMHPDEERFLKKRLSVLRQKTVGNSTKK